MTIVTESAKQEANGDLPDNAVVNGRLRHVSGESNKSTGSQQSAPEQDFVMVELVCYVDIVNLRNVFLHIYVQIMVCNCVVKVN